MFYADFVLSKKGPLARIWLAAHWDAKLTKAQIFETNIESSIERILRPKVKLALRTSGHLMLGVVRIYSRKTKYLLADCNEAFVKIKMAFRPGMVDLPENHREAAVNAVTLPEIFHDFDLAMPDLNDFDIEAQFSLNQSRAEEITIKEYNVPDSNMIEEDVGSFNNRGFDNDASHVSFSGFDSVREGSLGASMQGDGALVVNDMAMVQNRHSNINISVVDYNIPTSSNDGGLFEDPPELRNINSKLSTSKDLPELDIPLNDDDFGFDCFPPSPGGDSSVGSRPASPVHAGPSTEGQTASNALTDAEFLPPTDLNDQPNDLNVALDSEAVEENVAGNETEQTTLLQNEEESFALAPVNASALKGQIKAKRKRKLIVDEVKSISGEEMKAHLNDTSDIVVTLDLAPPTKRLMRWNETGGVEKLFSLPGRCIPSTLLSKLYLRHLTVTAVDSCENRDDKEVRGKDAPKIAAPSTAPGAVRRGRKRKQFVEPEEQAVDVAGENAQKTPRLSTRFNDENHLPPIPEEPADQEPSSTAALPQTTDSVPSPAFVLPVTTNENNLPLQSPHPEQDDVTLQQHEDPPQANADNLFSCGEIAALSPFQDNRDVSLNAATVNMGYDGQDQAVPVEDQNEGLFNFNQDLEHNPVTPGLNADGGITPWHDTDYDNPVSVGPPMEEQGADETAEQFEERILNKRAGQLYDSIKTGISIGTVVSFSDVVCGNARKQVAQKFYSLLVLKKHKILELTQEVPYGTIRLTKGSNFDSPKL